MFEGILRVMNESVGIAELSGRMCRECSMRKEDRIESSYIEWTKIAAVAVGMRV